MHTLNQKINDKSAQIAIVGLGYVGLTLLKEFAKCGFSLIGYDSNHQTIAMLQQGESHLSYIAIGDLLRDKVEFSADPSALQRADIFIIAVPTSLDKEHLPDLSHLKSATSTIALYLKKESLVISQSTSYPGTTEELLLPLLEKSQLKVGEEFYLAFIPETSHIGEDECNFFELPKVIGGVTKNCQEIARTLYSHIVHDLFLCSSPKVAEAAKILQNSYRLINIAFVNEMKIAFHRMGIDIWEVIEAASTKTAGFAPFYPGPGIGGDCIPVDPLYLSWKTRETEGPTSLIDRALDLNSITAHFVIHRVIEALDKDGVPLEQSKILVLGVSFKRDVSDIRESPALTILSLLESKKASVSYHDPFVPVLDHPLRAPQICLNSIEWECSKLALFDCVLILTDHSFYKGEELLYYSKRIVDTRNIVSGEKVVKA